MYGVCNETQSEMMDMIRFNENIRGEAVFKSDKVDAQIKAGKKFSVIIDNGKGELFFSKVDGEWYERIMSVDRCFGVMKSAPRKLKIT